MSTTSKSKTGTVVGYIDLFNGCRFVSIEEAAQRNVHAKKALAAKRAAEKRERNKRAVPALAKLKKECEWAHVKLTLSTYRHAGETTYTAEVECADGLMFEGGFHYFERQSDDKLDLYQDVLASLEPTVECKAGCGCDHDPENA